MREKQQQAESVPEPEPEAEAEVRPVVVQRSGQCQRPAQEDWQVLRFTVSGEEVKSPAIKPAGSAAQGSAGGVKREELRSGAVVLVDIDSDSAERGARVAIEERSKPKPKYSAYLDMLKDIDFVEPAVPVLPQRTEEPTSRSLYYTAHKS